MLTSTFNNPTILNKKQNPFFNDLYGCFEYLLKAYSDDDINLNNYNIISVRSTIFKYKKMIGLNQFNHLVYLVDKTIYDLTKKNLISLICYISSILDTQSLASNQFDYNREWFLSLLS